MHHLKQSTNSSSLAFYLFLYIPVVWGALLIAQSLGGGLPEIINNLTVAMQHPLQIQWTNRSLLSILICTGAYIMGITLYQSNQGRTRGTRLRRLGLATAGQRHVRTEGE